MENGEEGHKLKQPEYKAKHKKKRKGRMEGN